MQATKTTKQMDFFSSLQEELMEHLSDKELLDVIRQRLEGIGRAACGGRGEIGVKMCAIQMSSYKDNKADGLFQQPAGGTDGTSLGQGASRRNPPEARGDRKSGVWGKRGDRS